MGAHMHGAHLGAREQLSATFLAYQLVEAKHPLFSATVIHVPDWLALELLVIFPGSTSLLTTDALRLLT